MGRKRKDTDVDKKQTDGTKQGSRPKASLFHFVRSRFFPDLIVDSPLMIDYRELAARGFRLALIDIDNTLVHHGRSTGDDKAAQVIAQVRAGGLIPIIASNAPYKRARLFADSLAVDFIARTRKPGIEAICRELRSRECRPDQAILIGDQLLTDVWSARRAGMPVILTDRRSTRETLNVRIKRPIERLLILIGGRARWQGLRCAPTPFPELPDDRL